MVLCSTSTHLLNAVLDVAGDEVKQQLTGKDLKQGLVETSAGQLKQVTRMFFLPWAPPVERGGATSDTSALRTSLARFVEQAVRHALRSNFTSIGKIPPHL